MKTIRLEWEKYKSMVYPTGVGKDQERECFMAFIAGNSTMFYLMNAASEFPEDRAVQEVDKLYKEMHQLKSEAVASFKNDRT